MRLWNTVVGPTDGPMVDLGLDLGSSMTRVVGRSGEVVSLPTVVAFSNDLDGGDSETIGDSALQLLGRAPSGMHVVQPIHHGLPLEHEALERFVRVLYKRVHGRSAPRVVATVPQEATEVQRRALVDCLRKAGAADVTVLPSFVCAAIGSGIPLGEPKGHLLMELGAGRCGVTVLTANGGAIAKATSVGGFAMDEHIVRWGRSVAGALMSRADAAKVRESICAADPLAEMRARRLRVRSLATGAPIDLDITTRQAAEAIQPIIERLKQLLLEALAETPPELAADVLEHGMILCGGVARTRELDAVFRDCTGLPVIVSPEPEKSTIKGLQSIVSRRVALRDLLGQ